MDYWRWGGSFGDAMAHMAHWTIGSSFGDAKAHYIFGGSFGDVMAHWRCRCTVDAVAHTSCGYMMAN